MTEMRTSNDCMVKAENFDDILNYEKDASLNWPCVFVLPSWIHTWWKNFGGGFKPCLLSIHQKDQLIGLAMLKTQDHIVSFMGSADICDYLDFIVLPGKESVYFPALFDYFRANKITGLDLRCLRPDSVTSRFLKPYAAEAGGSVNCSPDGVSYDVVLPDTWDGYLNLLNSKQRHEVKRKLRRLYEAGDVRFDVYDDMHLHGDKTELFFKLFMESREDKSDFMTSQMAVFFKDMISAMAGANLLKLAVLSIDIKPVATLLFFDFNNGLYLYNNGYDVNYRSLSVGVLSKVLAIEHGIRLEKQVFDFLKGTEIYKSRLGGQEIQLEQCQISLF